MRTLAIVVGVAFVLGWVAAPSAQWYARGSFYNDWAADDGNMLNDDGVNGDAVAGDGIYSGYVTATVPAGDYEFKIALADWSESYPTSNVWITLTEDNQTVFFSLDTNVYDDGWFPNTNIVWSDAIRPGTTWGLAGGAPELGDWDPAQGPQASFEGGVWKVVVTFAAAGNYEYKWTADQSWEVQQLGADGFGSNALNIALTVEQPGDILFLFDPSTGRGWHGSPPTAAEEASWGQVKIRFERE
jgi:hypothetical protein